MWNHGDVKPSSLNHILTFLFYYLAVVRPIIISFSLLLLLLLLLFAFVQQHER